MLHHFLQFVIEYLQDHIYWGIAFAFVLSFAESLPLIGTIIPGSITMTAMGALVGSSILPAGPTLVAATIGAFIGDFLGYRLGVHFESRIENIWPFRNHKKLLVLGQDFFGKHGAKSVIIGRFVGPVRSAIPMIAGMLKMRMLRFLLAAIPSAALWAFFYMLPGIILGALSLELPAEKASKFVGVGIGVIILLWLALWLVEYFFIALTRGINRFTDHLWDWLNHRGICKPLVRWITNKNNPEDHHQLTLFLFSILSFILFVIVFVSVMTQGKLTHINLPIFYLFQSFHFNYLNAFFVVCTLFGEKYLLLMLSVIVSLYLLLFRKIYTFWHWLFLWASSFGILTLLKHLYFSPRPGGIVYIEATSSFPSGHTLLSFCILGFLAFLTSQQLKKERRYIPYLISTVLILLIILSRLYLGSHWLTDILGSSFLALAIVLFTAGSYRRAVPESLSLFSWVTVSGGTLIGLWLLFGMTHFSTLLFQALPLETTTKTSIKAWWNDPHEYTPIYRPNRFGTPMQPFNIQWAGSLDRIQEALIANGWIIPNHVHGLKQTLSELAAHNPTQQPILPWLYQDQKPKLLAIKTLSNTQTIVELRLWESEVIFSDSNLPLWIGIINYHSPKRKLLSFNKALQMADNQTTAIKQLPSALQGVQWKIINTDLSSEDQPEKVRHLQWDGQILLISHSQ